jgi:AraC-like DNA-binding protein
MISDFISFGGAFLAFVFAIHLFTYYKANLLLNRLLGLLFLSRALNNAIFVMNKSSIMIDEIWVSQVIQVMLFFSPALFYLYVRSFMFDETKLRNGDYLHLIPPFLIFCLELILFLVKKDSNRMIWLFSESNFLLLFVDLKAMLFLVYLFLSWKMLISAFKDKENPINKVSKYWITALISIVSLINTIQFLFCTLTLLNTSNTSNQLENKNVFMVSGILTTFFILFIMRTPNVLYGNLITRLNINPPLVIGYNQEPVKGDKILGYSNPKSLLEPIQIEVYIQLIDQYMKEMSPYLDTDFNIGQLSEKLVVPIHHLSFVLNQGMQTNFREYINKYRIDFFIKQFNLKSENLTLESIAKLAGFKSSSTFYIAFKKETGTSPKNYFH